MLDRSRFVVGDAAWEKVAPLLPGKATARGATGKDDRLFLEAALWRAGTGSPWRDPPGEFGEGNSVLQRFRRRAKAGVFERVFAHLSGEPDFEHAPIDGAIASVHQEASGAEGGLSLGPSAARAAGRPPRSSRWWMRWATLCASCCCRASAATWSACRP
jgi:transposase